MLISILYTSKYPDPFSIPVGGGNKLGCQPPINPKEEEVLRRLDTDADNFAQTIWRLEGSCLCS